MGDTKIIERLSNEVEFLKNRVSKLENNVEELDSDIHRKVRPEYLAKLKKIQSEKSQKEFEKEINE